MVFCAEEKIILHTLARRKPPNEIGWYSTLLARELKIDPRKVSLILDNFSKDKPVPLIKKVPSKNSKGYDIDIIELTRAGEIQEELWWDYLEKNERRNFIDFYRS